MADLLLSLCFDPRCGANERWTEAIALADSDQKGASIPSGVKHVFIFEH